MNNSDKIEKELKLADEAAQSLKKAMKGIGKYLLYDRIIFLHLNLVWFDWILKEQLRNVNCARFSL